MELLKLSRNYTLSNDDDKTPSIFNLKPYILLSSCVDSNGAAAIRHA